MILGSSLASHNLEPGRIAPAYFNFLLHETLLLDSYKDPMNLFLSKLNFSKQLKIAICPYKNISICIGEDKQIKCLKLTDSLIPLKKCIEWAI